MSIDPIKPVPHGWTACTHCGYAAIFKDDLIVYRSPKYSGYVRITLTKGSNVPATMSHHSSLESATK